MANPFDDASRSVYPTGQYPDYGQRSPMVTPERQRRYPPAPYQSMRYDDGGALLSGDLGSGGARSPSGGRLLTGPLRGGVQINGRNMPWVAGEDDEELKPLTA
jgi:hypothetical protein